MLIAMSGKRGARETQQSLGLPSMLFRKRYTTYHADPGTSVDGSSMVPAGVWKNVSCLAFPSPDTR